MVGFVERFYAQPFPRKFDLFGMFDHVAIRPGKAGVVGIQTCAASSRAEHYATIVTSKMAGPWLEAGNQIALISWRKGPPHEELFKWITRSELR